MIRRMKIVTHTAAMLMFAIWSFVSCSSSRISGMSGATANHAKKQTKNAIHVRWNVRIGIVEKLSSCRRVARSAMHRSMNRELPMQAGCQRRNQRVRVQRALSVRSFGANAR